VLHSQLKLFILIVQAFHPPYPCPDSGRCFFESGGSGFCHRFQQACWQNSCAVRYSITCLKTRPWPRSLHTGSCPVQWLLGG